MPTCSFCIAGDHKNCTRKGQGHECDCECVVTPHTRVENYLDDMRRKRTNRRRRNLRRVRASRYRESKVNPLT